MAPAVGLFTTCLADCLRPDIAMSALKLLRAGGAVVEYPPQQTCCGQIAFNSGYYEEAKSLVKKCAAEFKHCEVLVTPSGSCCAMLRGCVEELFGADASMQAFADKCMELSQYLHHIGYTPPPRAQPLTVTFHDSCSGLRELGIKQAPRRLLQQAGITVLEMDECEDCCGFGGRFSTQFGELSTAMADKKCANILSSGAQAVAAGDLGCLLHIEGRLRRLGNELPVLHWAQLLAQETEQ